MIDSGPGSPAPKSDDSQGALPDWAVGLIAVEAISLLIALAMPITPSKTGSTWSPAEFISPDPSYLTEVIVYFVLTNLLILMLGVGAWAYSLTKGPR